MQVGLDRRFLPVLLALVVATAASAAPTVTNCGDALLTRAWPASHNGHLTVAAESIESSGCNNPHLARLGREYLAPPVSTFDTQAFGVGVKPLPPVPAAVLMVTAGFFCVSLVKDRRVWFAVLTGALSLGQAGLGALPELAYHLASKRHIEQHSSESKSTGMLVWEYSHRSRSEVEGTQYIGLLRHLAGIPDKIMSLPLPASILSMQTMRGDLNSLGAGGVFAQLRAFGSATAGLVVHLMNTARRLDSLSSQPLAFSGGLIFSNLARGPPPPA